MGTAVRVGLKAGPAQGKTNAWLDYRAATLDLSGGTGRQHNPRPILTISPITELKPQRAGAKTRRR